MVNLLLFARTQLELIVFLYFNAYRLILENNKHDYLLVTSIIGEMIWGK